ncbi:AAA family ATPase [Streptomyces sp. NPDC060194]|uniref:AAA family ATPase n=1 Tax=Streptomyces sp. NPDC060194 TaxID=3347069 RepID=UPI003649B4AF
MTRVLIAMAGLPGAGKSTVAEGLARSLGTPVVSVDPVEAAMRRAGISAGQPTGLAAYLAAEAVADGILALGQSVIVDAVNAVEPAREQWRALAARHAVPLAFVEVVCGDPAVHRGRLESRDRGLVGLPEPTWSEVSTRAWDPWTDPRLTLDSLSAPAANLATAREYVGRVSVLRPDV